MPISAPCNSACGQNDKVQVLTGVAPREDVVVVGGMGVDDKGKVKVVQANAPEAEEDQPEAATPDKDSRTRKKTRNRNERRFQSYTSHR